MAQGIKLTKQNWIEKFNKIHNTEEFRKIHGFDHYDYSPIIEISGSFCKIDVICNIHKIIFKIFATNHGNGNDCKLCSFENRKLKNEDVDLYLKENKRTFKRNGIVNGYKNHIEWGCLIEDCKHIWRSTPDSVLRHDTECPKCKGVLKLTNEVIDERLIYLKRPIKRIGNFLNVNDKILWNCTKNTNHFWNTSTSCIIYSKTNCPRCKLISEGQKTISTFLKKYQMIFKEEFRIKECKNKRPLPFDFAVFSKNGNIKCLIEYDGLDHFPPLEKKCLENSARYNYKKYEEVKFRDEIKNKYCTDNNIQLIRIPYWEMRHIEGILIKELNIKISN